MGAGAAATRAEPARAVIKVVFIFSIDCVVPKEWIALEVVRYCSV